MASNETNTPAHALPKLSASLFATEHLDASVLHNSVMTNTVTSTRNDDDMFKSALSTSQIQEPTIPSGTPQDQMPRVVSPDEDEVDETTPLKNDDQIEVVIAEEEQTDDSVDTDDGFALHEHPIPSRRTVTEKFRRCFSLCTCSIL